MRVRCTLLRSVSSGVINKVGFLGNMLAGVVNTDGTSVSDAPEAEGGSYGAQKLKTHEQETEAFTRCQEFELVPSLQGCVELLWVQFEEMR